MKKCILLIGILFTSNFSCAQLNDPTDVAKEKATHKVNQKTDEAIDSGIDAIEDGINSVFKKKENKEKKKKSNSGSSQTQPNPSGGETDFSEYEGFTFVPGKNVIFFDDFNEGNTKKWKAYNAENYSVVSLDNQKWLELRGTRFTPINLGLLPDEVTIEFDIYAKPTENDIYYGTLDIQFVDQAEKERLEDPYFDNSSTISIDPISEEKNLGSLNYSRNENGVEVLNSDEIRFKSWKPEFENKSARISIHRKGSKITLYLNHEKLMDNVDFLNSKRKYGLTFNHQNYFVETARQYISNVRIAQGTPTVNSDLKSENKFVTNSIYFDVNSARIKPESWATLNQVAQAIRSTTGTIQITGHTDGDGADEANLTLSKNRAESVKNALINEFGIDASRLQTDGKGESQPIESNQTTSGKAQNRRVEFIKI